MQENKSTISRSTVAWVAIAFFGLGLTIYGVSGTSVTPVSSPVSSCDRAKSEAQKAEAEYNEAQSDLSGKTDRYLNGTPLNPSTADQDIKDAELEVRIAFDKYMVAKSQASDRCG